jgi:hypothetical protein
MSFWAFISVLIWFSKTKLVHISYNFIFMDMYLLVYSTSDHIGLPTIDEPFIYVLFIIYDSPYSRHLQLSSVIVQQNLTNSDPP